MRFRSHPTSAESASECESGCGLVARQFTREWIAAGQQPRLESAARRINGRPAITPAAVAKPSNVLQRTLFISRHPS
jgi:hypothetical protein